MSGIDEAHAALNAAYNALAVDRSDDTLARDARLACAYLEEARAAIDRSAARGSHLRGATAPISRASALLLEGPHEDRLAEALAEIGSAMDELERLLADAGR